MKRPHSVGSKRNTARVKNPSRKRASTGPAVRSVLLVFLGFVLVTISIQGTGVAADVSPPSAFPLGFTSEHIVLTVEPDSLRIDGTYELTCHGDRERLFNLLYPYPRDDRLGGARTLSCEMRVGRGPWRPGRWQEMPRGRGARWFVPVVPDSTVTVRTSYRQALLANYARYIVTTTAAWGKPLEHASFEIHLPPSVRPHSFSYPFVLEQDGVWRYEAEAFLPEVDISVQWEDGPVNAGHSD